MQLITSLLLAATAVNAHYTFDSLYADGKATGTWLDVRKTINWQNNGPVTDVKSKDIRCYELSPGKPSETYNVTAGSTIGFNANPNIYHPGPLSFWLARVPDGQSFSSFDGDGNVWFKIWHEQPQFGQQLTWTSNGMKTPSVTLPKSLPNGQYLFRIEHIGLHVAQSVGGAQFYISCAQINVSGGGSGTPGPLVALPGAYSAQDPGILININWPIPTSYKNPGPAPWTG